jgi:NAD(P)-dependent dehydrogenase (short-subunit alcohol dehydrogenase family)
MIRFVVEFRDQHSAYKGLGLSESKYRVALVTGASRGVGASVSTILARRGSSIIVNYHSKRSRAEDVASAVRALGQRALVAQADLTRRDQVVVMMDSARLEFGRIDTLILNASECG